MLWSVANQSSNSVSVLLGNGSGAFGTATNFAVGSRPVFIAAGDFNNDDNPDLAVANRNGGTVSILLNTCTAEPGEQISELMAAVESLPIERGIKRSLAAKLNHALRAVNEGRIGVACDSLNAFINEVEAQRGKKLTAAQADQLLNAAGQVIAELGCN